MRAELVQRGGRIAIICELASFIQWTTKRVCHCDRLCRRSKLGCDICGRGHTFLLQEPQERCDELHEDGILRLYEVGDRRLDEVIEFLTGLIWSHRLSEASALIKADRCRCGFVDHLNGNRVTLYGEHTVQRRRQVATIWQRVDPDIDGIILNCLWCEVR